MSEPRTNPSRADDARGHRRDRGLAVIAIFKLVKVVLLIAVGSGALELVHVGVTTGARYAIAMLTPGIDRRLTQRLLAYVSGLTPVRLEALGIGAYLYAALFAVEGVGLWRERRWAEYLTVIATASFVPVEMYELVRHFTLVRLSALVINVAMVAYLLRRLRLAPSRR
jgi:uncharacterized membrane protein (DUF2068 family)